MLRTKNGIFQNGSFPPPESTVGFFCSLHCENLVNLEIKLTKVYGPLWSFQLLDFSTEPLAAVHQFRLSYPCTGSPGGFCPWVAAPVSCDSLFLPICLSNFRSSSLLCDFNSLKDLKRVVDFQFVQLFTC